MRRVSVGLGDAHEFVLLLDSVAVGATLGSVGKALSDRLDVLEGGLAGACAVQSDG